MYRRKHKYMSVVLTQMSYVLQMSYSMGNLMMLSLRYVVVLAFNQLAYKLLQLIDVCDLTLADFHLQHASDTVVDSIQVRWI